MHPFENQLETCVIVIAVNVLLMAAVGVKQAENIAGIIFEYDLVFLEVVFGVVALGKHRPDNRFEGPFVGPGRCEHSTVELHPHRCELG